MTNDVGDDEAARDLGDQRHGALLCGHQSNLAVFVVEAESRWLDGKMLDGASGSKVNISFGVRTALETRKADRVAPKKTFVERKLGTKARLVRGKSSSSSRLGSRGTLALSWANLPTTYEGCLPDCT